MKTHRSLVSKLTMITIWHTNVARGVAKLTLAPGLPACVAGKYTSRIRRISSDSSVKYCHRLTYVLVKVILSCVCLLWVVVKSSFAVQRPQIKACDSLAGHLSRERKCAADQHSIGMDRSSATFTRDELCRHPVVEHLKNIHLLFVFLMKTDNLRGTLWAF